MSSPSCAWSTAAAWLGSVSQSMNGGVGDLPEYGMRYSFPYGAANSWQLNGCPVDTVGGGERHFATIEEAMANLGDLLHHHGGNMRVEFEEYPDGWMAEEKERNEYARLQRKYEPQSPLQEKWQAPLKAYS